MYLISFAGEVTEWENEEGTNLVVGRGAFRSTFFQDGDRTSLNEGQGHADRHQ